MKPTHSHNYAALELAHIAAMVSQLEEIVQSRTACRTATAETLPNYWRARIKAIDVTPLELQSQIRTLLARLDALEAENVRHQSRQFFPD